MEVKPGYKLTEVGVIPEDWEFNELSSFWAVTDCKHVTAEFINDGIPIASIREVQSRYVDLSNAKQTNNEFYRLLIEGERKPKVGDLILSRNATVGEIAKVADWHPPFAMGQDVCLLRKKSNKYSTDYLQQIFHSPIISKQLTDLMVGSTFKRVNIQQVKKFIIPFPPPGEQQAIAEALSDADALIESLEQLIAKKRQVKQGAMQELLTGKRRLPGFDEKWDLRKLGDLAQMNSGGTPLTTNSDFYGGVIPWVSIADMTKVGKVITVTERTITKKGLENSSAIIYPKGTVLYAMYASIGECSIAGVPISSSQAILGIRPSSTLFHEFLYYWFCSIKTKVLTMGQHGTQSNLNAGMVREFEIWLPNIEEQIAIANILSDMDAEIAALEDKLAKARQGKRGMMQELLTGRIRLI